ncbi:hypothetical protein HNV08_13265 [Winogradskyella eckloniae]|uniref:hypothetical protein n=1 Tax=Winogradskyella eckloniae TaxID=1089306 RepID=UPI0015641B55|nr:hypothetical protein [Winogradskyella eckloniae]NRD21020.1 hypothetical protein [Winogradskyella eckloniae]
MSFILVSVYGFAQNDINSYQFIIVPNSYEFSKSDDQYQLNSLTKFLFNKYGFEAYFVDEIPEHLKSELCKGLKVEVSNEKSGMFKTKLEMMLKDCYDAVVMTSKVGESRLKTYDKAYVQALREAFETFQNMDYEYSGDVQNKEEDVVMTETKVVVAETKTKASEVDKKEPAMEGTLKSDTKIEEQVATSNKSATFKNEKYYAQEISNGFQLVNSEPRVVMILLNTAAEHVFLVKGKSAIVFKQDGFWYYSENNGELKEQKSINIKF